MKKNETKKQKQQKLSLLTKKTEKDVNLFSFLKNKKRFKRKES